LGLDRGAKRDGAALLVVGVIAFAIAGSLLSSVPFPRFAVFAPVCYAVAIAGSFTTALILLAMMPTSDRPRTMFVLATSFFANSALLLGVVLLLPQAPLVLPVIPSPHQFAAWLLFAWHADVAVGAFAYLIVRHYDRGLPPSRGFLVRASLCAGAAACACVAASLVAAPLILIANGTYVGFAAYGCAGPIIAVLLGLAALSVFLQSETPIERAFAIGLACLTVGFSVFVMGGPRYSAIYYFGRLLVAAGSLLVLDTALRALIASGSRLREAEGTLGQLEAESAKRAGRVRAIWQIVSLKESTEIARVEAILQIATAAIRPGKPIIGVLSHQVGETVIIDATAWSQFDPGAGAKIAGALHPGATFPAESIEASGLAEGGRARAWDQLPADGTARLSARIGLASFVGAGIEGPGRRRLGFASPLGMTDEAYAEDDLAYVEVITSFFAARFRQQRQFDRIKFQIEHDALTGLENRVQFRAALREQIAAGAPFTMAFINLDAFRHVNERYGNQIGDELLVAVAAGLRRIAGDDFVARMDADEFAVMMRGDSSAGAAAAALRRYSDLFLTPFVCGEQMSAQPVSLGASIGALCFPADGASAEELLRRGDLALEAAKLRGGSATLFFEKSLETLFEATRLRVVELRDGIASDQLVLAYQPTFALATRRIAGAEALVRWNQPDRGMLLPAEFVDFAERNGLIAALTSWVFERVSLDILSARSLPAGYRIYFNLAASMLEDVTFIGAVSAALREQPFLAQHLGIEVTESAAMANVDRSMNTIALFRSWGLHVAIDHFGTGHSSLAYLKRLKVDVVKIDRSFVAGLPDDDRDGEVADMLLRVIARFGFATLAEGIETEAQAEWLLVHGCRFGQGFLVAAPRSFAELLDRSGLPRTQKASIMVPRAANRLRAGD
jgi:diguanylate cyclase (GGDEF)-like protein